jgi:hypothetical protein
MLPVFGTEEEPSPSALYENNDVVTVNVFDEVCVLGLRVSVLGCTWHMKLGMCKNRGRASCGCQQQVCSVVSLTASGGVYALCLGADHQ